MSPFIPSCLERIVEHPTFREPNVLPGKVEWHFDVRRMCGTLDRVDDVLARLREMRRAVRADLESDVLLLARSLDDKGEDITVSQHPADVASDLYAREQLAAEERTLEHQLSSIDDALARIARGTYGTCEACGQPIAVERLEALPQASRCIECQRVADRPRRRRAVPTHA